MDLHRIGVKYFLDNPPGPDPDLLIPVFHDWIRRARIGGVLIDVADYRHIVDGPGVVLVGHEGDYRVDDQDGGRGLRYVDKRSSNGSSGRSWDERLRTAFRSALVACRALEQEQGFEPKIRFRRDGLRLTLLDRLEAPNDEETLDSVAGPFQEFLDRLYHPATIELFWEVEDLRHPFSVTVTADDPPDLDTLIERLGRAG